MWTLLWGGLALLCGVAAVGGWTSNWNAFLIVMAFVFAGVFSLSLAGAIGHRRAEREPHEEHPPRRVTRPSEVPRS
jgi:hypothetical protein